MGRTRVRESLVEEVHARESTSPPLPVNVPVPVDGSPSRRLFVPHRLGLLALIVSCLPLAVGCDGDEQRTDEAALSSTVLVPGTSTGQLEVTPAGSVSYAMPITVAPGISGQAPSLSIQYSSHGANGILGQGFSLSGLSVIAPCPRTVAEDGVGADVTFTSSDRLCLDGQRLVGVNGRYNVDGAEYRTARESFSRIRQVGETFIVETMSGQRLEYGTTSDARIAVVGVAGPPKARGWALSRSSDRFGNAIKYSYAQDLANGDYWPTTIEYTENLAAGIAPTSKVEFRYRPREDASAAYVAGATVTTTQLLQSIASFEGGTEFHSVNFEYGATGQRGRARLVSAQECAAERSGPNAGQTTCLPPTRFEWTEQHSLWAMPLETAPNVTGLLSTAISGDFNGDGLTDLAQLQGGTVSVNLGVADGRRFLGWTSWGAGFFGELVGGDWNGDGKTDLLDVRSDGSAYAWTSSGAGFTTSLFANGISDTKRLRVADFNGDGRSDLFRLTPSGQAYFHLSEGGTTRGPFLGPYGLVLDNLRLGDLDGDGRADLLHVKGGQFWVHRAFNEVSVDVLDRFDGEPMPGRPRARPPTPPPAFTTELWGTDDEAGAGAVRMGDVNGDGKADLVLITGSGTAKVHLGTGRSFLARGSWGGGYNGTAQLADLDSDGKSDLFQYDATGTRLDVSLSNGRSGFDAFVKLTDRSKAPTRYATTRVYPRTQNPWGYPVHTTGGAAQFCAGLGSMTAAATHKQQLLSYCDSNQPWCRVYTSGAVDCSESSRCVVWSDPGGTGGASLRPLDGDGAGGPSDPGPSDPYGGPPGAEWETVASRDAGWWDASARHFDPAGDVIDSVDCQTADTSEQQAIDRFSVQLADLDGDGAPDILQRGEGGTLQFAKNRVQPHFDVVRAITSGLGARTEIDYASLPASPGVYAPLDEALAYPTVAANGAMYLVREVRGSDGARSTYRYEGARARLDGRGFLGFRRVTMRDEVNRIELMQQFRVDPPFEGRVEYSERRWSAPDGRVILIGRSRNDLAFHPGYPKPGIGGFVDAVVQTGAVEESWDLSGGTLPSITTVSSGHQNGSPSTMVLTTALGAEALRKTTSVTFESNEATWVLNSIVRSTTTNEWTGAAPIVHSAKTTFLPNGLVESDTVEPGNAAFEVTTRYDYDALGHVVRKTVSAADGTAPRTVAMRYDDPRFMTASVNQLGHATGGAYDGRFGKVTRAVDVNGLVSEDEYDGFGRKRRGKLPSGVETTTELRFCDTSCPPFAVMWGESKTTGGATQRAYMDNLGREVTVEVEGWDGKWVRSEKRYDAAGRVRAQSTPGFIGEPVYWSETEYDALGRVIQSTAADGGVSSARYDGLLTVSTDALGRTARSVKNAAGWVARNVDAVGSAITFAYDAEGHAVVVTDPRDVRHTTTFDLRGRRIKETSPDLGAVTLTHNAFGELVKQVVDATGAATHFEYDELGRVKKRVEPEGTTLYTYDVGVGAKGLLVSEQLIATGEGALASSRTTTFDDKSRPVATTLVTPAKSFTTTSTYDALSRPETVTSPSGLVLSYGYDARGVQTSVKNAKTGLAYWTALDVTADGQVKVERAGNGLTTTRHIDPKTGRVLGITTPNKEGSTSCAPTACAMDMASYDTSTQKDATGCTFNKDNGRSERVPSGCNSPTVQSYFTGYDLLGNVTARRDLVTGLDETFTYDELNRMRAATLAANGSALEKANQGKIVSYHYDTVGRLAFRSDLGQFFYDGPQPHAVTRVVGDVNASFTYDASGNMRTGHGRTLSWTSFNKPVRVESATKGTWSQWSYGPSHERLRHEQSNGKVTTHVSAAYEEVQKGADLDQVHRISAGHGLVAEVTLTGQAAANERAVYFGTDHLGSVTVVTNEAGDVVQRLGFDAFGKRRFASGGDDVSGILKSDLTQRGFTGHEMLDDLGLVHMNARLYDPLFGVFLSPDSVTQFAGSTQGWNRYSYVGQNPLSFVDPSGHKKWGTIFRVVVAIVAVVAIVMTAGAALGVAGAAISGFTGGFITAAVATAAVQAAVTTFVFTAIVSGSLRVAAKAALIAGVCGGLANAAGGGTLGGALEGTSRAALQGGDIKQGFITGVVPIASYYYAYKGKGTDGIAMLLGQKILADIASGAFELSPSPPERELMPSWEEIEATDEASWRYPRPRLQGRGDFAPQSLAESASSGRGGQDGPVGERLERLAVGARAAAASPASRDLGDYDPRPPVFSPTEALTNIAACAAVGVAAAQAGALIGGLGGPLSSAIWAFGFRFSATNLCTDASPSRDTGGYNLSDLGAP